MSESKTAASPAHVFGWIADSAKYEGLHPRFAQAFAFMRRPDLAQLPCGRYEIDGKNCWAIVQDAKLKPFRGENRYEVHRAYIDIQAPITGRETFGIINTPPEVFVGFNEKKDCVLFNARGQARVCEPGEFAIFFPGEGAHAPCLSAFGPCEIRKLVIKVRFRD